MGQHQLVSALYQSTRLFKASRCRQSGAKVRSRGTTVNKQTPGHLPYFLLRDGLLQAAAVAF